MLKTCATVILNSLKSNNSKTSLGRWSSVTREQSEKRAIRASNDHCGDCNNLKLIELEWILDEKKLNKPKKNLLKPDKVDSCRICGSIYHITENCPEKK
jgi:hypothetical protein